MIAGLILSLPIWALLAYWAGVVPLRTVMWSAYPIAFYVLLVLLGFDRRFEEAGDE